MSSELEDTLSELVEFCIRVRGLARLYILKVLVELDGDWQEAGKVYSIVHDRHNIHTNYIFEMARRFPKLVEISGNLVRIRAESYEVVSRRIDRSIAIARKAIANRLPPTGNH